MARRKRVSVINARVVPGVVVFAQLWLRSEAGCNEARVRLWTTAPARLDEVCVAGPVANHHLPRAV